MRWIVASFVIWLIATGRFSKWMALATTNNAAGVNPGGSVSTGKPDNSTPNFSFSFGGNKLFGF